VSVAGGRIDMVLTENVFGPFAVLEQLLSLGGSGAGAQPVIDGGDGARGLILIDARLSASAAVRRATA
jgi:hypothetical protein